MSHHLALLFAMTAGFAAQAGPWRLVGDAAHPNCPPVFCVVKEGAKDFEVTMVTEDKGSLTYLRRIKIKSLIGGATQEFETPAVNGAEGREPFKLYAVSLQNPNVTDLALLAYTSAQAGPSYYYFLFDRAKQTFVMTESTVPKLELDRKGKRLKTDVQGVEFEIVDLKLKER